VIKWPNFVQEMTDEEDVVHEETDELTTFKENSYEDVYGSDETSYEDMYGSYGTSYEDRVCF